MSKNVVETEGPQMTSQYGAYELHAGKPRLHARTHTRTAKKYCCFTATKIREHASLLCFVIRALPVLLCL